MAENQQPIDAAPSPRIDLAALSKRRRPSTRPAASSPMTSGRIYNVEHDTQQMDPARMQLISPPPEETLRRVSRSTPFTPSSLATGTTPSITSKRKRTQQPVASVPPSSPTPREAPLPLEATPNPKPRKQKRHARTQSMESPTKPRRSTPSPSKPQGVQSPHADKAEADYIPPIPLTLLADPARRATISRARRSETPIPHYEPPKDVFTPPREVFLTPTISKSSKRKSRSTVKKSKGKKPMRIDTGVKLEMPDIDINAPMPPASPSDDPILLSGSVEPSSPIRRRSKGPMREVAVSTSPMDDLGDVSRTELFDWNRHTQPEGSTDFSSMMMDPADADVLPLPLFDLNLPPSSDGGWSSDEDELPRGPRDPEWDGIEGVGEYTGKWRMMRVRTKMDPPSSATRNRMEEWGRPVSPFPKFPKRIPRLELVGEEEEGAEGEKTLEDILTGNIGGEEEEEVRRMSVEPVERERTPVLVVREEEVRRMSVEPVEREGTPVPFVREEPQVYVSKEQEQNEGTQEEDESQATLIGQEEYIEIDSHTEKTADITVEIQPPSNDQQQQAPVNEPSLAQEESDDEQEEREVRQMSVEYDPEEQEEQQTAPATIILEERHTTPEAASPRVWAEEERQPLSISSPAAHERESDKSALGRYQDEYVALRDRVTVDEDAQMGSVPTVDDDEDESDSSEEEEIGVVKITSADPRAAARAVAILKQHDYDCFTKIVMKQRHAEAKKRRGSHSAVDDIAKDFRRKNLHGVEKEVHTEKKRRRSTLGMGVIGDWVFIPGSPVITIPDLLKEAEAEVGAATASTSSKATPGIWAEVDRRALFKTPLPVRRLAVPDYISDTEHQSAREWTKEEWKLLDGCFTDERLEVGHRLDLGDEDGLAPVDIVNIENVVQKFVDTIGGECVLIRYGDAWSRDNLLQRAKALQKKQRAGLVAPPVTPYVSSTGSVEFGGARRVASMEVPDFTPLRRRPAPVRKHRPVPAVVPVTPAVEVPKKLPASLLAPYYSHLLEEAIAIGQEDIPNTPVRSEEQHDDEQDEIEETESILATPDRADMAEDEDTRPVPPPSIGKRVKGLLFSYLPTRSKLPVPNKTLKPVEKPGLPIPPPTVLEKPRGPVATPVRPPVPKPIAPKELVELHPAPPPPKPSMIPRVKPRRLVDLRPAPPPPSPHVLRPRRSSGGSVKDLVRNFEDMQARASLDSTASTSLQRVKSVGDLRGGDKNRPTWKP